ncbi:CsgBAC operon transcriptional regulatory protein [Kluyvera cryocrescens]|uniref:CsgBAC operon transcriptional regulatory protein n=1 Tax=Kluyvera cryocrescens TaxID=580 RepID=A0A485ANV3_KLUCR|nr:CsgBAC operon transcriptional regulatory protein [Kluyvera cryocrescens]
MAQWPALYGVFRHDDEESRLIEGVKAVLNGEQTAELSVMHPAMYAVEHTPDTNDSVPLTERECEILNELRHGATNMDIARALFISENTVRTHLYNVFPQTEREKQNPGGELGERKPASLIDTPLRHKLSCRKAVSDFDTRWLPTCR